MDNIVILDCGSQFTQLIARRVRELKVHSEILPYDATLEQIASRKPTGLIISGGPKSVNIVQAVKNVDAGLCIIDDLATWVETIMRSRPSPVAETYPEIDEFLQLLRNPPCELIVVTREMNMGLPSDSIEIRRYRDVVGRMNQRIAAISQNVWLCVSGLPLKLK